MDAIRLFLSKSTTDRKQQNDEHQALRELTTIRDVLEHGVEHEQAEMDKARSREQWQEVSQDKLNEYGSDETYADPKHHSYPLTKDGEPSRKRTVAAWDYIHQRRNAAKYAPEELERIKGRIRRFAKRHFDEDLQDVQKSRAGIREYVAESQKDGIRALIKAKKAHRFAYKTDARNPIFIPVNRINTPYQTENAIDPDKVNENIKKIKAGMSMPPLIVGYGSENGIADLHDGHHRLEAAKKSGHTHVPCVVGGMNEQRVKAAEKRYRSVWKSKRVEIKDGKGTFFNRDELKRGFEERYGHLHDSKNVRFHVTAHANDVLNEGFKPKKGKGIGGVSNNKGYVYTTKDRKYAEALAEHMNELERIRTSKDPLEEATQYTGRGVANYIISNMIPIYERNEGHPLTDAEKAMVISIHGRGGSKYPEMLPTSFFRDDLRRTFHVVAVDISKGEKTGESELFGGEEMWERDSVEPIPLRVIDEMEKSKRKHEYLTSSERIEAKRRFGEIQCSISKDGKGYFAYTHRARSKSYPSLIALPKKVVQFISSTA